MESLKLLSKGAATFENVNQISITQLEILKAIESVIPIFAFVDSKVLHEHLIYERNKNNKAVLDNIEFPSIEKKETAIYIFEFINFLRLRSENNSIIEFPKIADIEEFLRKQWSALFQRLLSEQKLKKTETRRFESLSEELEDIKSLILSSISAGEVKEISKGVLKFRRCIEFLSQFQHASIQDVLAKKVSFEDLFKEFNIDKVEISPNDNLHIYFIKPDDTFYIAKYNSYSLAKKEWEEFLLLNEKIKNQVIAAIVENAATASVKTVFYKVNMPYRVYSENIKKEVETQQVFGTIAKNRSFETELRKIMDETKKLSDYQKRNL